MNGRQTERERNVRSVPFRYPFCSGELHVHVHVVCVAVNFPPIYSMFPVKTGQEA